HAGRVTDLDVPADPGVLVDDRVLDHRVRPDPEVGPAGAGVVGEVAGLLVEVGPDDVGVPDRHVLGDLRADADHRVLDDRAAADDAAVGDQAVGDGRPEDARAGQVARAGEHRVVAEGEVERRVVAGEVDVRLVEGADGPDVF